MVHTFQGFLNETYQQQAVNVERSMQSVVDRIAVTKQKIADSMRKMQDIKDRIENSTDDITRAVYQAKLATTNARRASHMMYVQYLQSIQAYYQAKSNEITAAEKNSKKPK